MKTKKSKTKVNKKLRPANKAGHGTKSGASSKEKTRAALTAPMPGVAVAIVQNVDAAQGRVQVSVPSMQDSPSLWAPIASLMAGKNRGVQFMPENGDQVLVAFEQGDPRRPYVLGSLWNGTNKPPATDSHRRLIRSVNGHEIEIYDSAQGSGDRGYIRIKDADGNTVELAHSGITIQSVAGSNKQAPNISIKGAANVSIQGTNVSINGIPNVNITAAASLSIQGTNVRVVGSGSLAIQAAAVSINGRQVLASPNPI